VNLRRFTRIADVGDFEVSVRVVTLVQVKLGRIQRTVGLPLTSVSQKCDKQWKYKRHTIRSGHNKLYTR